MERDGDRTQKLGMPRRSKIVDDPEAPFRRTFIREWRMHRDLSLERLGDRIDMSAANLSRLERGLQPYDQGVLEALAYALNCDPADLLMRNPLQEDALWDILNRMRSAPAEQQATITAVVDALLRSSAP